MLSLPVLAAIQAIVLVAFVAEAAIGFGATVITVTLAVLIVPLNTILPAFVPVNMTLSLYLAVRNQSAIAVGVLVRELAPAVLCGLGVGIWLFRKQALEVLVLAFASFIVVLSIVELVRARRMEAPPQPLSAAPRQLLLALGGFVHGLFGTGGPMIVYVLQRRGLEKGAFRASLAVVWLTLNTALMTNFASLGLLNARSFSLSATIALALVPALLIGERLHHRLSPRRFTLGIFSLLLIAGLALAARTTLKLVTHT